MRSVDDVSIALGDKAYRFTPSTARPQDMPYLLLLFTALMQPVGTFDVLRYVNDHGLWHCFKER